MSINWNNIRAIEGQREGFEELVCQLAGQEKVPNQVLFTRIGKPDGGKECYWELGNGEKHCWQAKYFTISLSDNQWTQVDKSVKSAIDNHPKLKKYYIAIPVDRPDGKVRGKSMLQKWQDHVTEWEKYATSKKMKVSFEYWGKHELETRLRKPENEGLIYYFFNETELTDQWFDTKNQESIDALGVRYTPELNFDLPFLSFHDGLTRQRKFSNQINSHYEVVLEKRRRAYLRARQKELEEKTSSLDRAIKSLREVYEKIVFSGIGAIPFGDIKSQLKCVDEAAQAISNQLYEWQEEAESTKKEKGERIDYYSRPYNNELNELRNLSDAIDDFRTFLDSEVCTLANDPYLILVGPAGIGKSHALADMISGRNSNNYTSLLLLGENFSTNEMPWTQILRNQLRFDGNEDVLLGALNAKAESQQNRIIIVIDALNEGNGRRVWPKKLKSFVRSFRRFPWLGLIVSIRNSFENLIAPVSEIDNSIASRIYHPGFEGLEYEASIHFFKHYDIIPPGSPLLHPEFQNPLFLKLFCEGLKKRGLKLVPNGYQGISAIIENYLEGVEEKLAQPNELDYDRKLKLLRKAVEGILAKMVEDREDHLPYEIGEEIANNIFSGKCGSQDKQYLKRLISEGVINEDLYWKERKDYDGIHFAYQRFQDHLIVSALLDKYLDPSDPRKSFDSGALKELLADKSRAYYNQNIIEALSVQVPERIGNELHEVAPYAATYYVTATAFIDGLMWRRTDTIGEASRKYVNEVLGRNDDLFYRFLEMAVSMATKPDFYFNADRQHKFLYQLSLSERDKLWTTWLQNKYGEHSGHNAVKRLINWAWNEDLKAEISDESARLAGVMLAWFLTSSNRYLRDAATKASVCLLQNRIVVLIKVLQQFEGVNDPYVYERLYAVAYGCALRTQDQQSLVPLSNYIYKAVFDNELIYPHILLRDYARGVIEYTIHLDLKPAIVLETIRPPYKSEFPSELPTIDDIDAKYQPKGKDGNHGRKAWGATAILMSMTTEYGRGTGSYGDFGRYTFESALSNWEVDCDGLSNYAIQRVFELGYDPEVFTDFDARQGSGRGNGHLERIGKKYQWIVFYEILASVSDNCKMHDEGSYSWSNEKKYTNYNGPWRPYVRDIDPTIIVKTTQKENSIERLEHLPWWVPCKYENWKEDAEAWKRRFDDFPPIQELMTVKDSEGVEWLSLNMHPDWGEPNKLGEDRWGTNRKRIWYDIGSWLVEPRELRKMLKVDHSANYGRGWSPEVKNRYQVFSREYYWSPASFFFQLTPYYGGDVLPIALEVKESRKKIAMAHHTAIYFLWEEEFDCSKEESISYFKPAPLIVVGLNPSQKEGEYLNDQGELVCFDPSVYEKGPACLLMRKDHIQKILKESGLRLVWIIQGEKQILGNSHTQLPRVDHTIGGLYHMDVKGTISGEMQSYIRDYDMGKEE
ncbi:MAG: ATP-binding protein [Imperialibacter sp.]|uniref:ATP-binding protein n=1 Tax=Imperialibacter sp. TaxID=2038411 RepID=UPI0032EBCDA3